MRLATDRRAEAIDVCRLAHREDVRIVRDGDDLRARPRGRVADLLLTRLKADRDDLLQILETHTVTETGLEVNGRTSLSALIAIHKTPAGTFREVVQRSKLRRWWRDRRGGDPVPRNALELVARRTAGRGTSRLVVGWQF